MNATGHRFVHGRCAGCDASSDTRVGRMRCASALRAEGSVLRHRHHRAIAGRLVHPDDFSRAIEYPAPLQPLVEYQASDIRQAFFEAYAPRSVAPDLVAVGLAIALLAIAAIVGLPIGAKP